MTIKYCVWELESSTKAWTSKKPGDRKRESLHQRIEQWHWFTKELVADYNIHNEQKNNEIIVPSRTYDIHNASRPPNHFALLSLEILNTRPMLANINKFGKVDGRYLQGAKQTVPDRIRKKNLQLTSSSLVNKVRAWMISKKYKCIETSWKLVRNV